MVMAGAGGHKIDDIRAPIYQSCGRMIHAFIILNLQQQT